MAIVNEDPAMLKYMLDNDEWSLHQNRCIGSFFSAFDQKDSRVDDPSSEEVHLKLKTNYKGTDGLTSEKLSSTVKDRQLVEVLMHPLVLTICY